MPQQPPFTPSSAKQFQPIQLLWYQRRPQRPLYDAEYFRRRSCALSFSIMLARAVSGRRVVIEAGSQHTRGSDSCISRGAAGLQRFWRMSLSSSGVGASGSGRPAGAIKAYRGEQQTCGAAGKDRKLIFGGHPRHRGLGVFSNANPIPVLPMSDSQDSGLRFFPPKIFDFPCFKMTEIATRSKATC